MQILLKSVVSVILTIFKFKFQSYASGRWKMTEFQNCEDVNVFVIFQMK